MVYYSRSRSVPFRTEDRVDKVQVFKAMIRPLSSVATFMWETNRVTAESSRIP